MLEKAIEFATKAHGDQKRKYTNTPYITHPIAVSKLLSTVTKDKNILEAAILHDTIEDTDVELNDLIKDFGLKVAMLVWEVTDISKPEDGKRVVRKEIDRMHLKRASPKGKTIKLADLIHNSESIIKCDEVFAKIYMGEKRLLLKVLGQGNKTLFKMAKKIVNDYYRNLK